MKSPSPNTPTSTTSTSSTPSKPLRWYHFSRPFRCFFALLFGALLGLFGLWLFRPFPHDCLEQKPPQSTLITDRYHTPLRVILGSDESFSLWQPLDAFGEWLPKALIAAEDKRFPQHCGVDFVALSRAFFQNLIFMRRISGASTISTQVIRLAQPRPRVLSTKIAELFLATQMERLYSKDQILEQYLNRAPFGGNFIGAEAAARKYFGKHARDLSIAEAALLAGLPQSPTRHRPDIHPGSARARRTYVLERMLDLGSISHDQFLEAQQAPIPLRLLPYPFFAPHFCDMLSLRWGTNPPPGEVQTTLDLSLQSLSEKTLRAHVNSLPEVHGGAALLLHTPTQQVLAWVGSPDYSNLDHAGQFDAVLAWRSPGSALKPFAYALALDQGRITPASILPDLPRQYGAFTPGNFDGSFRGSVSARDALVLSLNAPALHLVALCGIDPFLQTLSSFGIHSLHTRSREHNGLGAVIGNSEVRLYDLTSAYAALANCISNTNSPPISPPAAWITLDMLAGDERSLTETGSLQPQPFRPRTAWKTGTSAGFRDALTIATSPTYTLGIWLGNPTGRPAPALVGIEAAAPLAFQILHSLPTPPETPLFFPQPPSVQERRVCPTSGLPPGPLCSSTIPTWAIQGISSPTPCKAHNPTPSTPSLAILSPAPNATLQSGPLNAGGGTLPLRARGSGHLYWFLDHAFLADAPASEPILWTPTPGTHTLRCVSSNGASDEISFQFLP